MADRPRFTSVTPGDPVVPRGNRRFRREPVPADHVCGLRCRLLGLEYGHVVSRTAGQVVESIREMRELFEIMGPRRG